jgi:hypothetical protein
VVEFLASSQNATVTSNVFESRLGDEFWADGAGTHLGGGKPEIVDAFHTVVGPLVSDRIAESMGNAVRVHDITAHEFGFFTAVLCEGGDVEKIVVAPEDGAVAFVEPFGLDSSDTVLGFPSAEAHLEHSLGVGLGRLLGVAVHLCPTFHAT